jgi:hypothetical protein
VTTGAGEAPVVPLSPDLDMFEKRAMDNTIGLMKESGLGRELGHEGWRRIWKPSIFRSGCVTVDPGC